MPPASVADRYQRLVVEALDEHAGRRAAEPNQPNVDVQQIAGTLDRVDVVLDRCLRDLVAVGLQARSWTPMALTWLHRSDAPFNDS